MEDSRNPPKKIILQGKSNYEEWVQACEAELRKRGCYDLAIAEPPMTNPQELDVCTQLIHTAEYLVQTSPRRVEDFNQDVLKASREKWLRQEVAKFEKWQLQNYTAIGVIYTLCDDRVRPLLAGLETAREMLQTFKSIYGSPDLAAVYRQTAIFNRLALKHCANMKEYITRVRANKESFEDFGVCIEEDLWVSVFLRGLDDRYQLIIDRLLESETCTLAFEDVVDLVSEESLKH